MLFKNTLILTLADILKPIFALLLLGYITRTAGADTLGQFNAAISFIFFFETIAAFGLSKIITRQVAVDISQSGEYLTSAAIICMISSLVAVVLIQLLLGVSNYSSEIIWSIQLLAFSLFFHVMTLNLYAIFEGHQRMELKSVLLIGEAIGKTVFGIIALYQGYGLYGLIFAVVVTRILVFCIALVFLFMLGVRPQIGGRHIHLPKLLKDALIFLVIAILSVIYWRTDVLMLSLMRSMTEVGIYTAASRITESINYLCLGFITALFPLIALQYKTATDKFKRQCKMGVYYLFLFAFPTVLGVMILAEPIIKLVYGEGMDASVDCLQILVWSVCFFPLALVFANALTASNNQIKDLWANLSGALLNVALNLLLIPKFGVNGAAIATLISFIVLSLLLYYFARPVIGGLSLFRLLRIPFFAACVMAVFTWWLRELSLLIVIPLSMLVYGLSIYLCGGVKENEKQLIQSLIAKVKQSNGEKDEPI